MGEPERETCQHAVEGIYHGRTELGIGQHDKIKTRLNEELHTDYGDHLKKDESDRVIKIKEDGEPQTVYGYESSTGSVADIGYESSMDILNKRKQLSEDRKSEYEAHLAAKSGQTFQQDGSGDASRMSTEEAQDGSTMVDSYGSSESFERENFDEHEQNQHDYAESLREQIAEKKTITDKIRKKQDFDDEKNDWSGGRSGQYFNFESASMKGFSGSSQSSEQEESDARSQKQHDYADALKEQIAEKKKITDTLKKKHDIEDERHDFGHGSSHHFDTQSRSMKGFSGSSQSFGQEEVDERRQKQQDYAEALREQIAEKKTITDRIKKIQGFEDDRNERAQESSTPVPHYFNSESPKTGYPASLESYGQDVVDERRQKQEDYAEALREQIADKKVITDRIKKKEDDEDEKNEWDHGSSHRNQDGSYGQLNSYGGC